VRIELLVIIEILMDHSVDIAFLASVMDMQQLAIVTREFVITVNITLLEITVTCASKDIMEMQLMDHLTIV